jgi:hypothetical protein
MYDFVEYIWNREGGDFMKLSEYLNREVCPESFNNRKPKKIEVTDDIMNRSANTVPDKFELETFQFLYQNRRELGIRKSYQLKNASIDGLIILDDSQSVAIEIKYRMNWLKACQTGWQLEKFLRTDIGDEYNPKMGFFAQRLEKVH